MTKVQNLNLKDEKPQEKKKLLWNKKPETVSKLSP
jgi:hypothetical protein